MLALSRKKHILELLARDRQVIATVLSEALGTSEDTIRRDLRELAAEGLLRRVHGGAVPVSPAEVDFERRQTVALDDKAVIGKCAAAMIKPGQVVILDGGTTAVQLARHIPAQLVATVVTHSPSIVVELARHAHLEIVLIGGRIFKHSIVSIGAQATEAIARIRADTYFMGVTGVHPDAGLTTGDFEEASIKLALSRSAAETFVLASSEKIGTASPYLVMPVAAASGVITSASAPERALQSLRDCGVQVYVADVRQ